MEAEKRQKKKAAVVTGGASTPKKRVKAKETIIGSSSTWTEEQLYLFRVTSKEVASAKEMIPEKWFDFSSIDKYQAGIDSVFDELKVARDILYSIQYDDILDNYILSDKTLGFPLLIYPFIQLRNLLTLRKTGSRKAYLAEKRRETRARKKTQPVEAVASSDDDSGAEDEGFSFLQMPPYVSQTVPHRVGPDVPWEQEDKEPARVPSIADPDIPSAGSSLFHACRESTTQFLGNQFMSAVLMTLFKQDPSLDWVTGRKEKPVVRWREEYSMPASTGLIVGISWLTFAWERNASEFRQMVVCRFSFRRMASRLNGTAATMRLHSR